MPGIGAKGWLVEVDEDRVRMCGEVFAIARGAEMGLTMGGIW